MGFVLALTALLAVRFEAGPPPPARQESADSVSAAVQRIAFAVGQARSGIELLRRASGNDTDAGVVQSAVHLRSVCETLAATVETQSKVLCRHCLEQERQAPIDAYREYLPSLERAGRQCASTTAQLARGSTADAARRIRRQAVPIGERLVAVLVPYEQRLGAVRVAFGWAPPPAAPPRRG